MINYINVVISFLHFEIVADLIYTLNRIELPQWSAYYCLQILLKKKKEIKKTKSSLCYMLLIYDLNILTKYHGLRHT